MEIWRYAASAGIVAGLGHLVFFLFILLQRSNVTRKRLALLYLGISLLWTGTVIMADPRTGFSSAIAETAVCFIPVFTTALAVAQLLLICAFLGLPIFHIVSPKHDIKIIK